MVSVRVVSGGSEVGGVCILVEDGDRRLVFDAGVRFSVFRRYFSSRFFEPRGVVELSSLGVVPPVDVFEGVDGFYVSHFHLDHVGLLHVVPSEVSIRVPSLGFLDLLSRWFGSSPSWLAYVPPRYDSSLGEVSFFKGDDLDVLAVPVFHSAFPASSFLYFGSDESVLYTGDFRVGSLLKGDVGFSLYDSSLLEFFSENSDFRVDVLVVEGTNFGNVVTPLNGSYLVSFLRNLLVSSSLVLFVVDHNDLEVFLLIYSLAKEFSKEIVLASRRLADVIEFFSEKFGISLSSISFLDRLVDSSVVFQLVSGEDIVRSPGRYLIVSDYWGLSESLYSIDELKDLRGKVAVLLTPEPYDESSLVSESSLNSWLRYYHFIVYRLRVSGHYYPHELEDVLKVIKPKRVIPVHSRYPNLVKFFVDRFRR